MISSQQYTSILCRYILTGLGRNEEGSRLEIHMDWMGNPNKGTNAKWERDALKATFPFLIYRGSDLDLSID